MKQHTKRTIAIVTGASSGIGEALASAMAAQGTHVVLVARSVDRLTALATRIENAGGTATVIPVDLAAPGAAQTLFDEVERRKLPVDTLVNNAGFGFYGPFETEAPAHLSEMLQVNVVALTELTRLFVPSLFNAIRPVALGRKSWLFTGSHDAAQYIPMYRSLFGTSQLIRYVLTHINSTAPARYHTLLPHNIDPALLTT